MNRLSTYKAEFAAYRAIKFVIGALAFASCTGLFNQEDNTAYLVIDCGRSCMVATRSGAQVPDPDDFILTVTASDGSTVYDGRFADSPEKLKVTPGNYTVSAVSGEFSQPGYDNPQYGDLQLVAVPSGSEVSVTLDCRQINSGLRLSASQGFRSLFPDASFLLSGTNGELAYFYGENRTAFFKPGRVELTMVNGTEKEKLFNRYLSACEILSVNMTASESDAGNGNGSGSGSESGSGTGTGIKIHTDSTRVWSSDDYIYGEEKDGTLGVAEARNSAPMKGVWVYGYIVGAFSSSSKCEFEAPFTKNTNIVLGSRTSSSDKNLCIAVELKSGSLRDSLNLADTPGNLGRKIRLKGDLVSSYYGITGLKNVSDFSF